jgi:hypothetical protein
MENPSPKIKFKDTFIEKHFLILSPYLSPRLQNLEKVPKIQKKLGLKIRKFDAYFESTENVAKKFIPNKVSRSNLSTKVIKVENLDSTFLGRFLFASC